MNTALLNNMNPDEVIHFFDNSSDLTDREKVLLKALKEAVKSSAEKDEILDLFRQSQTNLKSFMEAIHE